MEALQRDSLIVARGKKSSTLYNDSNQVNAVENPSCELWHKQLVHLSEKGLDILVKKQLLLIIGISFKTCTNCLAGKLQRFTFHKSLRSLRSHVFYLIHTDVCSMIDKSLDDALHFVTFIDDHSRKVWAYCLKSQDHVLNVFKCFHTWVERQIDRKLKCVRTDNGGEYQRSFEHYC